MRVVGRNFDSTTTVKEAPAPKKAEASTVEEKKDEKKPSKKAKDSFNI